MKIKTMWGLRVGGTSPELMTAWDELCVEEHPGGFAEDCALRRRAWGSDLKAERFIDIEVDMERINEYFRPKTVEGKVAKPTGLEEAALHGESNIVVPPSLRKGVKP
jgi:hypothetical protein